MSKPSVEIEISTCHGEDSNRDEVKLYFRGNLIRLMSLILSGKLCQAEEEVALSREIRFSVSAICRIISRLTSFNQSLSSIRQLLRSLE